MLDSLRKKHNAVLIAIGSPVPAALGIPGADLEGVYYALTLLEDLKQGKKVSLCGRVIVIGGGYTAMDVGRAALRLGAGEVYIACLETLEAMPVHPWEIERAKREGAKIHPCLALQKFRNDGTRKIAGVDFRRVASLTMGNKRTLTWTLQEGAGSETSLDAEAVIVVVGQTPALPSLEADGQLKRSPVGTLAVDPETLACNIPGLFATGDVVAGAGTVVESMAAGVTGIAGEDVVKAARLYAIEKPGCIYIRLGSGAQQITSTQTCRAISILIGITANVDARGGNLLYYKTFREALMWHPYLMFWGVKPPAAVNEKRIGAKEYPLMHKRGLCHIPSTIRAMEEGEVRAMWCIADNLIVAEMDNKRNWEILKDKLDFFFVSDLFMAPTAELADVVLPAAFYPECDQLVEAFGHPSSTVTATKKVVEPSGECRDDREVAIEIAKRMGMDASPWDTLKDYLNWMLKYQGITYDELLQKPNATLTFPRSYERYRTSTPPFSAPTGEVELYSKIFEAMGVDPLPVFQEPPESSVRTPGLFEKFPFIYTHYRIPGFMHSEGRQIKRRLTPESSLQINLERGTRLGIAEGDWVYLETPKSEGKGGLKFRAQLVAEMHPDVVAGPHAWWFPERPKPEYGCFDSDINALVTLDPPYDPVVEVPQVRAILCRVWKADAE